MTSAFLPLALPPGVYRGGTEYQAKGRWYDVHLCRWYGLMGQTAAIGPIGGWTEKSTAVTGTPRAIITWRANDGTRRAGIGTHSKLYAMSSAGGLTDITAGGFTSGRTDATVAIGYGTGLYGIGTYGTPRSDAAGNPLAATVWDLDIWGQYLVGCSHDDGKLYEYQNAGSAAQIASSPTSCYGCVVHPKRFLIALGAGGNPRKWQWCDQGVNTTWTPAATNQAGSDEIPQGKLICGRAVGDQVLMLSDVDAHAVDYIGLPYVLRARKVGDGCGAISKGSLVSTGSFCAWWSKASFWLYDGAVRPLQCDVWDDLVRNLTVSQQSKISGWHNVKNQEIWWFYPSGGAIENSNYIFWSYKHNIWGNGSLVRLAGCAPGIFENPFCMGSDGKVYEHELGFMYSGSTPYARSGPVQIGNGDRSMHVLGIINDSCGDGAEQPAHNDDVVVSFRTRSYPVGTETVLATTTLSQTGKTDLRFSARQASLVVTGAKQLGWRWGEARLLVAAGGRR